MGPFKMASALSQRFFVAVGKESPSEKYAAAPNGECCRSKSMLFRALTTFNNLTASAIISGPMPSPSSSAIVFDVILFLTDYFVLKNSIMHMLPFLDE